MCTALLGALRLLSLSDVQGGDVGDGAAPLVSAAEAQMPS
jgi:hypothetical protein